MRRRTNNNGGQTDKPVKMGLFLKFAKKINENWFSFFSGVVANVPITLLLTFDKNASNGHVFWPLFICLIFAAISAMFFSLLLAIEKINIKEKAKDEYDTYVMTGKIDVPKIYDILLKTKYLESRKRIHWFMICFLISIGLTIAIIIPLWIFK